MASIFMYFGTKILLSYFNKRPTIDNNDFIKTPATVPATAPPPYSLPQQQLAQHLAQHQAITEQQEVFASNALLASQLVFEQGGRKYFNGFVKNNYFYLDDKVLKLNEIIVHEICISAHLHSAKSYSGKITLMGESGEVFKHDFSEKDRVITLPKGGLEVNGVTVKVKMKSGESVDLLYSIVYSQVKTLAPQQKTLASQQKTMA